MQTISRTLNFDDAELDTATRTITIALGAAFAAGAMLLGAEVRVTSAFVAAGLTSAVMAVGTGVQATAAWSGSLLASSGGSSIVGGVNPLRAVAGETPQLELIFDADPNTLTDGLVTIALHYIVP